MSEITNYDDVIDSRDVIARIEELEGEREELDDALATATGERDEVDEEIADIQADADEEGLLTTHQLEQVDALQIKLNGLQEVVDTAEKALADWDEEFGDELKQLTDLQEEAEGCGDWKYGATLIRETYFEVYAKELCEEIGDIPRGLPSYIVIDWEATAKNLEVDYTTVDFGGVDYLIRS